MHLQRATRILNYTVLVLSLLSFVSLLTAHFLREKQKQSLEARTQAVLLSQQLAAGSDTLTAAVRAFAVVIQRASEQNDAIFAG